MSEILQAIQSAFVNRPVQDQPALGIKGAAEAIESAYAKLHSSRGADYAKLYSDVVSVAILSVAEGYGPMAIGYKVAENWVGKPKPGGGDDLRMAYATLEADGYIVRTFTKNSKVMYIPVALSRTRTKAPKATEATPTTNLASAMFASLEASRTGQQAKPKAPRKPRIVKPQGQAGPQ